MEIRQVEYVAAVADHGGFTKAAAAEHVSQPALSEAVGKLERELGVLLFHRAGRQVALTSAGEAFLGPARRLLRDVGTLRSATDAVAGLEAGHLDLVALPTLAVDPLALLIGAFRRMYPGVAVRLAEPESADAVVDMVRDGRCELGLAAEPLPDDLEARGAFAQEILAVCPPDTVLSPGRRIPVSRLATMPLVTTPPGTSTRRLVEDAFAGAGVVPVVAVETGQREAIVPLVLAGAGVTFLPPTLAAAAAEQGAKIAKVSPAVVRRVAFVHRHGPVSPAAAAFLELATGTTPRQARRGRPARPARSGWRPGQNTGP